MFPFEPEKCPYGFMKSGYASFADRVRWTMGQNTSRLNGPYLETIIATVEGGIACKAHNQRTRRTIRLGRVRIDELCQEEYEIQQLEVLRSEIEIAYGR